MQNTAYLSLGSNINPESNIKEAINLLSTMTKLVAVSSVWETQPVGLVNQPLFLNAAIIVKSELNARQLKQRVLQDHHAADSLSLKNHLKTVERSKASTPSIASIVPPLSMPELPSPIPSGIPPPTIVRPSVKSVAHPQSEHSAVLTAAPSGTKGISKSKVGLKQTFPPVYPRIARESGWEGTVVIRVTVLADGTPEIVQLRKSSGYPILDDAAIDAVHRWEFVPAKDGNISVPSIVEIPINFDLRQQG